MNEKSMQSFFRFALIALVGIAVAAGLFVRMQGAGAESLEEAKKNLAAAQAELAAAQQALNTAQTEQGTIDSVVVQAKNGFSKDFVLDGVKYYVPANGSAKKPTTNVTMVAVRGQYVNSDARSSMDSILAYINEVRKEAYNLGYTSSYVPLQYDARLTRYAQVRAAEASICGDHIRPSKTSWYQMEDEGFCSTYAENLSWGSTWYGNVDLWVQEKSEYEKAKKGQSHGQYGHYTTLISPKYKYIGIGQFNTEKTINPYGTAMAAEFSGSKPSTGVSDVKAVNEIIYQLVWAYTPALSTVSSNGIVSFSSAKATSDPVWTRASSVYNASTYVQAQAQALLSNYNSRITAKQQAVATAQAKVDAAQERVNALGGNSGSTSGTGSGGTSGTGTGTGTGSTTPTTTKYTIKTAASPTAGGTVTGAGTFESGKTVTLVATPKSGYTFSKWSVSGTGYTSIKQADGSYKLTFVAKSNITVTATFATTPVVWNRLWGQTALDTMQSIIKTGWSQSSNTVVVATMKSYHDALSAAPLAGVTSSPILLTSSGSLSAQTKSELQRLKPQVIYLAGGEGAISKSTLIQISSAVPGATVRRVYGQTAIETASALALQAKNSWSDTAVLATTKSYHDALSAAPLAYKKRMPIFLTNGSTLTSGVVKAMKDCGIKKVIIVGGTGAISKNVESVVKSNGFTVTTRLAGATAIETSRAIATYGLNTLGMSANKMGIATTKSYYDALCGAPLCGLNNSVLVLTNAGNTSNASFVSAHKATSNINTLYIFGGTSAVSTAEENAFKNAVK